MTSICLSLTVLVPSVLLSLRETLQADDMLLRTVLFLISEQGEVSAESALSC